MHLYLSLTHPPFSWSGYTEHFDHKNQLRVRIASGTLEAWFGLTARCGPIPVILAWLRSIPGRMSGNSGQHSPKGGYQMVNQGTNQSEVGGSMNRRTVLKGAVAAGVGVAAWSVPSITSAGGTPAYAAVCTVGFDTYVLNVRNTDCGGCDGSVRIKDWSTSQCQTDNYPPGASLANGACAGTANALPIPNPGVCPLPGTGGVCVNGVPLGETCKLRLVLQQNNCGGTEIRSSVSASFFGPGFIPLPGGTDCVPGDGGNLFSRIEILCSTQAQCLPPST
jgi:hypothetical protein